MKRPNFDNFLNPHDAIKRFQAEMADGSFDKQQDAGRKFSHYWAVARPETNVQAIGEAKVPKIILTTAEALKDHRGAFADMDIVPAYGKGDDE